MRCNASHTESASGDQSRGSSDQRNKRKSPLPDSTTPVACSPEALVLLARARTSASPNLPVVHRCSSNQCRQNCVAWSKSSSARNRLISCTAVYTRIGVPSASSTSVYWLKIAKPGPRMACDKSTGATGEFTPPRVISSRATIRAELSSRMNSRRLIVTASLARPRHTKTMLEANALLP